VRPCIALRDSDQAYELEQQKNQNQAVYRNPFSEQTVGVDLIPGFHVISVFCMAYIYSGLGQKK